MPNLRPWVADRAGACPIDLMHASAPSLRQKRGCTSRDERFLRGTTGADRVPNVRSGTGLRTARTPARGTQVVVPAWPVDKQPL